MDKYSELLKQYQQYFKDGLLIVDCINEIDDFAIAEDLLLNSPIHYYELFDLLLRKKKYSTLFKYAIDFEWGKIASYIVKRKLFEINDEDFEERVRYEARCKLNRNGACISENESYFQNRDIGIYSVANIDSISKIKQGILLPLKEKWNKKRAISKTTISITKEYLDDLFVSSEYEILTIKLCTKFEAILYYMGFEGDFFDMLSAYCEKFHVEEDKAEILHNLRKSRNKYVHANVTEQTEISKDELRFCIDYICALGE